MDSSWSHANDQRVGLIPELHSESVSASFGRRVISRRKNSPVDFVFLNQDATIPRVVHNKCVARVKLDRLAVSGEASHQIGASSNRRRLAGQVIARFEDYDFSKRVESG